MGSSLTRTVVVLCPLLGCGSGNSDKQVVANGKTPVADQTPAADKKGPTVKKYWERDPVATLTAKPVATIAANVMQSIAVSSKDELWAAASAGDVQIFRDDKLVATHQFRPLLKGGTRFSKDDTAVELGTGLLRIDTGEWVPQPTIPDLARWAGNAGYPAPPTLAIRAASHSEDGKLLVAYASGETRDRTGRHAPETGSSDWLIALDGASRAPTRVLWHGKGEQSMIAISDTHVAAGGDGLRIFDRAKPKSKPVDLSAQLTDIIALTWSPDGSMLAALGQRNKFAVWRLGGWSQPIHTLTASGDYGSSLAFHPTRPVLFTGDRDNKLRAWSVAKNPPVLLHEQDLGGVVRALALSRSGAMLLAGVSGTSAFVVRLEISAK